MPVQVRTENVEVDPTLKQQIKRRAQVMLETLDAAASELSLLLCNDAQIQVLNLQYRNKDCPTDVLAFAMQEGEPLEGAPGLLGDVVISVETAQRQAEERGRSLSEEITFLLAHGLLHLLGYDHQDDEQEARMNQKTELICAAALR